MSISYMKIIKEVMGEEAQNRGYKITSHPKLIATKPLAYFNREKNGSSQGFEITEYLIGEKTLFLRCCGKEIHLKYNSAEEFEDCIRSFNDYMLKEGYDLLEQASNRPNFTHSDNEYVLDNYKAVFEEVHKEFEGKTIKESLDYIEHLIQDTYKQDFLEAKDLLLKAACILTGYLLKVNENIYITNGTTTDKFYLERNNGLKRRAHQDPCNMIITAYRNKDTDKWFRSIVNKFFTEEELN